MGLTDEDRETILQGYRDLKAGKLDTVARQTALNHASEDETSVMLAACPQRVRAFTMEEYDAAGLDYAHNLSPEVEAYLEPFSKEGWPQGGPNPENPARPRPPRKRVTCQWRKRRSSHRHPHPIHRRQIAANDRCNRKGASLACARMKTYAEFAADSPGGTRENSTSRCVSGTCILLSLRGCQVHETCRRLARWSMI